MGEHRRERNLEKAVGSYTSKDNKNQINAVVPRVKKNKQTITFRVHSSTTLVRFRIFFKSAASGISEDNPSGTKGLFSFSVLGSFFSFIVENA